MGPERHWAVTPAAGIGRRMAAAAPKQYLPLAGKTVLECTLERMLGWGFLEQVVVALHEEDGHWRQLPLAADARVATVTGGEERGDSVRSGLERLRSIAAPRDWVWIHDAVRPCVSDEDVEALRAALEKTDVGALLARPVVDTVKLADAEDRVARTVDRSRLWLAQTPQVFRLAPLSDALAAMRRAGLAVTDESSAVERLGLRPTLVAGNAGNIKLTRPEDLALAERWLRREEN